jgi:hypothetical protein
MKIRLLVLGLVVLLSGCSSGTSGTPVDVCQAVSITKAQQVGVEAVVQGIIALHKNGSITDAMYAKVQPAYQTWYDAQGAIVSTLVGVNDGSLGISFYWQEAQSVLLLIADINSIYNSAPAAPTTAMSMQNRPRMAATPPTACTIADADIQSELVVPTWAQISGS